MSKGGASTNNSLLDLSNKTPSIGSRHNTKMAPAPEKDDGTNDQDDVQGLQINLLDYFLNV